ncbi:MAG: 5-(carboxyamino)imidazole ribonucleotide synthase [Methylophilaceae bacterium]|jgi:5-(carboxyamino)imidazole ribonucleotide synthase|uniref:5-(carboxyamino)imidazole ribonucleotide synthase n=1 Tax=Methylobacillus sp. MM3 TaxID=1848039 RepID=UPI0007E243ED|nr:5-(carboxyamino)imidazole ribonucleotide synthase [Methylobacillus sp. MM3]OAJ69644.1 5-(carboxyamino)imidazole ribonucleotide synthase [Methylobacillus sp. MM3]
MILPPSMLGMLGGGQLARFFVIAAHEMGYRVMVLDPDKNSPAGLLADVHLCAAYDDQAALDRMAQECVAVTTEFENVPASTLSALAQSVPVHPAASAVAICQHRISEKGFLRDNGFPHAPYAEINAEADIPEDNAGLYPGILKVARFGYDGKGQARVSNREEAAAAFRNFKGEQCVLEKMLALDYEVSVVLARDAAGNVKAFPVAENIHRNGILDISIVPARGSAEVREQAQALARGVAAKLNYVGTLGVEFFVCNGSLYVNEMAPRPHNSGHYTIDACVTDQFEQQIRALCGLPLGDTRLHSPAVMVNLLGDIWRDGEPEWEVLFEQLDLKLHLYGKHEARPGRKMGHFTVIGEHAEEVVAHAMSARRRIKVEG